jgi:serine/threonine protein kinase
MYRPGDEIVPGYRLEKFLGKGQFGQVWRASAPGGTVCALKILSLSGRPGWKELRAMQFVRHIRHPHLAPVYAMWLLDADGRVMDDELLSSPPPAAPPAQGTLALVPEPPSELEPALLVVATVLGDKTLGDRLRECQQQGLPGIPVAELLPYLEAAARGLDFLNMGTHELGDRSGSLEHCDIKPDNILLIGNEGLICDFGVAQVLSSGAADARTTSIVGSPAYISPECIACQPNPASDQYSLALTYFELRTGTLPFPLADVMSVLDAHRSGNLDLSALPPAERAVIRRATALLPQDRYPSSQDMAKALRQAVENQPVRSRRGWLAPAAVVLAAAVYAVAVWLSRSGDKPVERPDKKPPPTADGGRRPQEPPPTVDSRSRLQESPPSVDSGKRPEEPPADFYAQRALAAVAEGVPEEQRLAEAVADYRRAIELAPAGPYDVTPPPKHELRPPDKPRPAGGAPALRCLAVSGDARQVFAAGEGKSVWVWNVDRPTDPPREVAKHETAVWSLAVGPRIVVSADSRGEVLVTQLDEGRFSSVKLPGPAPTGPVKVAVSRDGQWLGVGGDDGLVRLARADRAQPPWVAPESSRHREAVSAIDFSDDGRWAATASWDDTVKGWPVPPSAGAAVELGRLTGDVYCLLFVPGARGAVFAGEGAPAPAVGRGAAGNRVGRAPLAGGPVETLPLQHEEPIQALACDAAGRWLASGADDGTVQVCSLAAPATPPASFFLHGHTGPVRSLAFCPLSGWLLSGSDDKTAALWRLVDPGQEATPVRLTHGGRVLAVAATAKWIVTASEDGAVRLWSLGHCALLKRACDTLDREPRPPSAKSAPVTARWQPSAGPPASALAGSR